MQPDPIGYADGANLYRYVHNDPLNLIDPEGLAAEAAKDVGLAFMRNLEVSVDALTRSRKRGEAGKGVRLRVRLELNSVKN